MSHGVTITARRQLRKVLGPALADVVRTHDVRLAAHAAILHRGFWGRLRWLLLGR